MNKRQNFLKAVYPMWMKWARLTGINTKKIAHVAKTAPSPFHDLKDISIDGSALAFADFKGKKILLVNTASDCGYTGQYAALQELYEANRDKLVVIGFPANDFKNQEQADNSTIAAFCKLNYGVAFPLVRKSRVIRGEGQNPVFKWLTDASLNGWNNQQPTWNFSKYLVDEEGRLTHFFGPTVEPGGKEIRNAIKG